MKLNKLEFFLVNNPFRAYLQEKHEMAVLMQMLSPEKFDSVLEIGCGNGAGTKLIKKYFHPDYIVGIDFDEKMIQIAKQNVIDPIITFEVMDASKIDFPDVSIDAIFDFGVIHHIPNWQDCIDEIKRVLKPGGKLIIEELSRESFSGFSGSIWKLLLKHPYEQMFSTNEFIDYLKAAGFKILEVKKSNPLGIIKHFFLIAES